MIIFQLKFVSAGLWLPGIPLYKSKGYGRGKPLPTLFKGESYFALCREADMFISMAITYLIMTIVAGIFGFGVLEGDAAWILKAAFFTFLVAFVISFFMKGQPSYHNRARSQH